MSAGQLLAVLASPPQRLEQAGGTPRATGQGQNEARAPHQEGWRLPAPWPISGINSCASAAGHQRRRPPGYDAASLARGGAVRGGGATRGKSEPGASLAPGSRCHLRRSLQADLPPERTSVGEGGASSGRRMLRLSRAEAALQQGAGGARLSSRGARLGRRRRRLLWSGPAANLPRSVRRSCRLPNERAGRSPPRGGAAAAGLAPSRQRMDRRLFPAC